jgi:radical SAM protein with 4Fe4S-binding SPASM domain
VAYGKGAALRPPHPAVLASLFTQSPEFKGFAYTPTAQVCKAGRARAFIDAEFNLYSCFESRVAVANMITEDFSAVWTDDDRWGPWRRSALAQLSQCGSCDLQRGCHICPAPEFDGRGATCSSRQLAVARETTAVLRRQDWEA